MGNLLLFFILAFSKEGRGFQGKLALAVFLELQQILRAMILRLLCFQFTGGWAVTDVPSHGLTRRGSGSPRPADSWDLWAGACCQCVDQLL